jgi:hypothetical protein
MHSHMTTISCQEDVNALEALKRIHSQQAQMKTVRLALHRKQNFIGEIDLSRIRLVKRAKLFL